MKYCKRCIMPDTRPDQIFDKNGFDYIIMARIKGVPSYDKLDGFYEKLNFKSLEETYIKCLNAKPA